FPNAPSGARRQNLLNWRKIASKSGHFRLVATGPKSQRHHIKVKHIAKDALQANAGRTALAYPSLPVKFIRWEDYENTFFEGFQKIDTKIK
ncbi:MAG: hypothetical protein FWB91_13800, partial [Defluviitaleaceae bacterium]|nr:hypothetical protein [Defluviitaleaceae bacterium]